MIIEFAGLPGSGKSTIARRLAEQAGVDHRVVAPWWPGLVRYPVRALGHALRPGALGTGSGWPAWLVLWLRSLAQDGIANASDGTQLLEEGYVHHLWRGMFLHPRLAAAPWRTFPRVPHPLIVLDLDRASRSERIASKPAQGKVNRQLAAAGPSGAVWDRAEALFEMILAEAVTRRTVVRVSTEGTVEEASERLQRILDKLSEEREGRSEKR